MYSYQYEFLKAFPKLGIEVNQQEFFPKKKGDYLVSTGVVKFVGKYKLELTAGGTSLVKC